jgi:hypothetical protein
MKMLLFLNGLLLLLLSSRTTSLNEWLVEKREGYAIYYTASDQLNKKEYADLIDNGISSVSHYFGDEYKSEFVVFVHPTRHSLDSLWQWDWNMPGFKSECWMVVRIDEH